MVATFFPSFILALGPVPRSLSAMSYSGKLLRKKTFTDWPFHGENFRGMLKPIIGWYCMPKFHGEIFCGWLQNREICEYFESPLNALHYKVFYRLNHDVLVMFVIQIYRYYQVMGPAVDTRLTRQRGGSRVDWSLQSVVTY